LLGRGANKSLPLKGFPFPAEAGNNHTRNILINSIKLAPSIKRVKDRYRMAKTEGLGERSE